MKIWCPDCIKRNTPERTDVTIGMLKETGTITEVWDGYPTGEVEEKRFSPSNKFLGYKIELECSLCHTKFRIRLEV